MGRPNSTPRPQPPGEHEAEDEIAPASAVVSSATKQSVAPSEQSREPPRGASVGNAVVGAEVVEVSGGRSGEEQEHAGEAPRRKSNPKATGAWSGGSRGRLAGERRFAEQRAQREDQQHRGRYPRAGCCPRWRRTGCARVRPDDGSTRLSMSRALREPFSMAAAMAFAVIAALFGGDGEVQDMDEHEAESVIRVRTGRCAAPGPSRRIQDTLSTGP